MRGPTKGIEQRARHALRLLSCWFLTPYLHFETTQAMLMMPFTTLTMSETESAHCPYMQLLRFKAQPEKNP